LFFNDNLLSLLLGEDKKNRRGRAHPYKKNKIRGTGINNRSKYTLIN